MIGPPIPSLETVATSTPTKPVDTTSRVKVEPKEKEDQEQGYAMMDNSMAVDESGTTQVYAY